MPGLRTVDYTPTRHVRDLWDELLDGTLVYRAPTADEAVERRARRARLFSESNVPWILSDVGGLLQFFDDGQDLLSFSTWTGSIAGTLLRGALGKGGGVGGLKGIAAAAEKLCKGGRPAKRHAVSGGRAWHSLLLGVPLAGLLRLLPPVAPIMWALLAGQVALSLLGVGIRLGAVVGASLELTFLPLDILGFKWGKDHNKAHELTRARILKMGDRAFGALPYLPLDDRITTVTAYRLAGLDLEPFPHDAVPSSAWPAFTDLFHDPFGTIKTVASLGAGLVPSALAFGVNDLLGAALLPIIQAARGDGELPEEELSRQMKALLKFLHAEQCPAPGACVDAVEDRFRFFMLAAELAREGLIPEELGVLDQGLYGGLFGPVRGRHAVGPFA